jgi:hypothetical protein
VEKGDRGVNEPIQFMTARAKQPYELIVNDVKKDTIGGYLSVPKFGMCGTSLGFRVEEPRVVQTKPVDDLVVIVAGR